MTMLPINLNRDLKSCTLRNQSLMLSHILCAAVYPFKMPTFLLIHHAQACARDLH